MTESYFVKSQWAMAHFVGDRNPKFANIWRTLSMSAPRTTQTKFGNFENRLRQSFEAFTHRTIRNVHCAAI